MRRETTDEVRIERRGELALLVVDRPRALNAIARHTMTALGRAVAELSQAQGLRGVVLAGGGGRFIAGGDLRDLGNARTAEEGHAMAAGMQAVLAGLEDLPVPVIAAIERYAFGGGAEVALACDLRVMGHDALFGLRHRRFGVVTAWGGTRRLTRLVGRSRAMSLLWTGRDVPASEALSLGLADAVAPAGTSAIDHALALAAEIATGAPGAVAATKQLVVRADLDRAAHGRLEANIFGEIWAHPDHWQRVDAFWAQQARRKSGPLPGKPTAPQRGEVSSDLGEGG